jgi:hypothetical protein
MIGMSNGMNIGDEFALKKATSYGTTGQKRLILYFINSLQNNPISFFPSKMILLHKTLLPEIKEAKFLFLVFIKVGNAFAFPHFTTYNY